MKIIVITFMTLFVINSCNKQKDFNMSDTLDYNRAIIHPPYPLTSGYVKKYDDLPKNEQGIPLLPYKGKNELYPITYTQAALYYYHRYYITNNDNTKAKFLNIANYIKDNVINIDDFAVLQYNFHVDDYNYELPATSSMSQGFALAIMSQAYSLTKDKSFLDVGNKILNSFGHSLNNGGVRNNWDGLPFYEEYIDPKSHVLNGFIFSLFGLYYYYKTTNNELAKKYFDEGIITLKSKLPEFDAKFTSYYSKLKNSDDVELFASAINDDPDHYHELVIAQLLQLYIWTEDDYIKEFAHEFAKYDTGHLTDLYDYSKYSKIEANYTIDPVNHGTDQLDNELWSWGKYWSTYKFPTDLIIELDEKRNNISAISFYATSDNTRPKTFDIYISDNKINWKILIKSDNLTNKNTKYYKTGIYETYIDTYYFSKSFDASYLKVVFHKPNKENIIALREINVHFNRNKEINYIIENLKFKDPFKQ